MHLEGGIQKSESRIQNKTVTTAQPDHRDSWRLGVLVVNFDSPRSPPRDQDTKILDSEFWILPLNSRRHIALNRRERSLDLGRRIINVR